MSVFPSQTIFGSIAFNFKTFARTRPQFFGDQFWQRGFLKNRTAACPSRQMISAFLTCTMNTSCAIFEVASMNFNPLATYVKERQGKRVIRKVPRMLQPRIVFQIMVGWHSSKHLDIRQRHSLPDCHPFDFVFFKMIWDPQWHKASKVWVFMGFTTSGQTIRNFGGNKSTFAIIFQHVPGISMANSRGIRIRQILISNNGMAAAKAILSMRRCRFLTLPSRSDVFYLGPMGTLENL